jgi:hypothetical protein
LKGKLLARRVEKFSFLIGFSTHKQQRENFAGVV